MKIGQTCLQVDVFYYIGTLITLIELIFTDPRLSVISVSFVFYYNGTLITLIELIFTNLRLSAAFVSSLSKSRRRRGYSYKSMFEKFKKAVILTI